MMAGPHGHRPATPALEARVRPTRYASLGPTCRGTAGLLDSGHGPGGRAPRRPGALSGDPKNPRGAGRTEAPGLPRASAARRGGRGDLALLSTRPPPPPPPFCLSLGVAAAALPCRFPGWAFPGVACAGAEDWGFCPPRWRGASAPPWVALPAVAR